MAYLDPITKQVVVPDSGMEGLSASPPPQTWNVEQMLRVPVPMGANPLSFGTIYDSLAKQYRR